MKIAILLRGQSHKIIYNRIHNKKILVNYKNSLDNYKKNLFQDNDVDVFFHTFNSDILNEKELLNDYKPVKYLISKDTTNCNTKKSSTIGENIKLSILYVIKLFLEYIQETGKKYDFIVLTRFDLKFMCKIDFNVLKKEFMYILKWKNIEGKNKRDWERRTAESVGLPPFGARLEGKQRETRRSVPWVGPSAERHKRGGKGDQGRNRITAGGGCSSPTKFCRRP